MPRPGLGGQGADPVTGDFLGTKPMEERHRFDPRALELHLQSRIEGFSGPLAELGWKYAEKAMTGKG